MARNDKLFSKPSKYTIVIDEIKMVKLSGNIGFGQIIIIIMKARSTYVMDGSGEPPMLLHVKSIFLSSVAVAMVPGATIGGCGGVNIVIL